MTSGFVAAGSNAEAGNTNDEWEKAKKEIEAVRQRRAEQGRQDAGKSLYETLQQNQAAKEEAFAEKIKLKNQFRSLNEDEVEYLDSVLESTRAKEDAVKRETAEQLDVFRRQQEEAEKALLQVEDAPLTAVAADRDDTETSWATGSRKRKKPFERDALKGVKIRRTSDSPATPASTSSKDALPLQVKAPPAQIHEHASESRQLVKPRERPEIGNRLQKQSPPVKGLLGLAYNSDDDDD